MIIIFKIIILGLILLICTYLGIMKAKKYENRVEELKKIKNSIEIFRSKIQFTYEPIKDIFEEISKIVYSNKSNIFINTIKSMNENDISSSWNFAVEKQENLLNEDKENIKLFGKLLGKTDKLGQINEINLISIALDKLIEKAENEKCKNYKLFKSLGTTIGIGLCILLI